MKNTQANYPKGSILIWTLLLGLSLATTFFFFSQRLNINTAQQRQLMSHQAQTTFLKSYADHLESLSLTELENLKGDINFEGVTGTLTNDTLAIEGILDAGETSSEYSFGADVGGVNIYWNQCSNNLQTDLIIVEGGMETIYPHVEDPCPSGGFDDMITMQINGPFQLKSTQAPFAYWIESDAEAQTLTDNVWHLNLELVLNSRKKIYVSRIFVPQ